jgi:deoxyadenosine/deoxycytidine kinase
MDAPRPDLVVYLQAPAHVLLHRIRKRGRSYEQPIARDYLERISASYAEFFCSYVDAPLLIVNAAEIDLVDSDEDFQLLLKQICKPPAGRRFFNPLPLTV